MKINNIFTSFFAEGYIDIEHSELIEFCYDVAIKRQDWNKNISLDEIDTPSVKYIKNEVNDFINEVHTKIGLSPDYKQEIVSTWGNIGYPNRTVMSHCHHGTFFSAILYLTDSKEEVEFGNLFFMDPDRQKSDYMRPKHIGVYNEYTSAVWGVNPTIGKLIVFPSWLWHYVCADPENNNRISIAFDTQIVKK